MEQNLYKTIELYIASIYNNSKEFICNGTSFHSIYLMALFLKEKLEKVPNDVPVCIFTDDKSIIAAAVLAYLSGGPALVLPYSFSDIVLDEVKATLGFSIAIIDKSRKLPPGIEGIIPEELPGKNTLKCKRDINDIFLHLYTGGSTGSPKVWKKTLNNIFSEVLYHIKQYNISEDDCFLSTVPPQHIYGFLFSVLLPMLSRATVLDGIYTFPEEILNTLAKNCPSILVSVPIHYRALRDRSISPGMLRIAFSSAGPLNVDDAGAFTGKTGVGIIEVFGSTETGGIATRCLAEGEQYLTSLEIVDWKIENDRLYVRSPFVSSDLNRDFEGFFKTGDCALFVDKNNFSLSGRADGVVKIAGKRVNFAEIQEKIKKTEGVSDAIVSSIPAEKGRELEIVAFYIGDIDEKELRKNLMKNLEPYSMPRYIQRKDSFPMNSTGKLDYNTLMKSIRQSE